MKDQIHIQKKQQLDKKIQEFCGAERWEQGDSGIEKQESKTISHPSKNFLIEKYKSKFPSVASVVLEQRKVIRL